MTMFPDVQPVHWEPPFPNGSETVLEGADGGVQFNEPHPYEKFQMGGQWLLFGLTQLKQLRDHWREHRLRTFFTLFDFLAGPWLGLSIGTGDGATTTFSLPGKEIVEAGLVIRKNDSVFAPYLSVPVNSAFTAGAGTLTSGTYYYRVTALSAFGETTPSTETSLAITGPAGVNVNWAAVPGATGYKIYGRSSGAQLFIAQVAAGVTTYLDNGSVTPAGAMPAQNTAKTYNFLVGGGAEGEDRVTFSTAPASSEILTCDWETGRQRFTVRYAPDSVSFAHEETDIYQMSARFISKVGA